MGCSFAERRWLDGVTMGGRGEGHHHRWTEILGRSFDGRPSRNDRKRTYLEHLRVAGTSTGSGLDGEQERNLQSPSTVRGWCGLSVLPLLLASRSVEACLVIVGFGPTSPADGGALPINGAFMFSMTNLDVGEVDVEVERADGSRVDLAHTPVSPGFSLVSLEGLGISPPESVVIRLLRSDEEQSVSVRVVPEEPIPTVAPPEWLTVDNRVGSTFPCGGQGWVLEGEVLPTAGTVALGLTGPDGGVLTMRLVDPDSASTPVLAFPGAAVDCPGTFALDRAGRRSVVRFPSGCPGPRPGDLGPRDLGPTDQGRVDLGPTDASQPDSGPSDRGPADGGPTMADAEPPSSTPPTDPGRLDPGEAGCGCRTAAPSDGDRPGNQGFAGSGAAWAAALAGWLRVGRRTRTRREPGPASTAAAGPSGRPVRGAPSRPLAGRPPGCDRGRGPNRAG
jgi:hypothetical protein